MRSMQGTKIDLHTVSGLGPATVGEKRPVEPRERILLRTCRMRNVINTLAQECYSSEDMLDMAARLSEALGNLPPQSIIGCTKQFRRRGTPSAAPVVAASAAPSLESTTQSSTTSVPTILSHETMGKTTPWAGMMINGESGGVKRCLKEMPDDRYPSLVRRRSIFEER